MEISILLITYNHERFVRQTLDSIIMQKINVPYEIIVLDDASTDHTPQILREYKKKYSLDMTLYLRKTNRNSTKNGYFLLSKARGKYFAFIEGDDYWTDEFKIQKQYDFLEHHPDYSGCMTDLIVVDENSNSIEKQVYERKENRIYTLEDFRHLRGPGMTVAFLGRNYFDKEDYRVLYQASRFMGDITIYMLSLLRGDIYQLDESMAAYRYVCMSGKSNFNSAQKDNFYKNYIIVDYWIRLENFMRRYDKNFAFISMNGAIGQIAAQYSMRAVLNIIRHSTRKGRYLLVFLIYRYLLDSRYMLDKKNDVCDPQKAWNDFREEKKPVVLFGAGAVAEEYLDKYAWEGNILFLVDNDRGRLGASFKGFWIKRPEELIKYKDRVKVLITNVFHETEIANQLEEMGIKDYYCYCSMQTNRMRNIIAKILLDRASC